VHAATNCIHVRAVTLACLQQQQNQQPCNFDDFKSAFSIYGSKLFKLKDSAYKSSEELIALASKLNVPVVVQGG